MEVGRLGPPLPGTVAGHLIECGAQATGGLWINWYEAPDLANVGYPIAEIDEDGTMRITKPEGSGGAVNIETVSEQLLYEVGDPAAYLTPDVVADFTTVTLREVGRDVVQIDGARGKAATESYKVSCAYRDGWMASGTLLIWDYRAAVKARRCGEMVLDRLRRAGVELEHSNIETLGAGFHTLGVEPRTGGMLLARSSCGSRFVMPGVMRSSASRRNWRRLSRLVRRGSLVTHRVAHQCARYLRTGRR